MVNNIDGYLNKRLDIKIIRLIYSNNNITPEISLRYKQLFDYTLYKINETYLGGDIINNYERKEKHFNWCWNQFFNFHKDMYSFLNVDKLKNVLFSYFLSSYYDVIDLNYTLNDEKDLYLSILSDIHMIFTLNTYKTKYYIDELLTVHESINQLK